MPTDTRTPLDTALDEAIAFATAHGVDSTLRPTDFGIQRSEPGFTTATYVDGDHVVTVTINPGGRTSIGVAELAWVHDESDEARDPCDYCGECENCGEPECACPQPRPMTTLYLPGDAPEAVGHG